ncbi:polyketide synthase [Cavenderia fasciculata]|uniref:Polyketide synthase n=1 Tax=Cavenderia fasciculata TaxID=261658 RepID=F4QFA2_CACFS|nr:polyketide synthase [Cavenderia fasciculata]EGG13409.1 polyketide synthase [Cavenderia fasciculata]|eukprot:XP_004350113.1 polyketide synthase [Cavenderia fasciculata]
MIVNYRQQSKAKQSKTMNNKQQKLDDDIAIVGIGCRLPGGSRTPQQFYDQLIQGLDGITTVTPDRWSKSYCDQGFIVTDRAGFLDMTEWTHFDRQFFRSLSADAQVMDPQMRLFVSVVWEALEDARIDPASIRGSNTSVFIGQMFDSNSSMQSHEITTMKPILRAGRSDTALKVAYQFDFRGPALSVDTACSSSLIGILQGIDTLRSGESDISICGGMNAFIEPTVSIHFTQLGLIGKSGKCASFDSSVDGYVRSEGVGVVVLKRLSKAIEDNDNIYCVIKGGNCNADGNFEKTSPTAPSHAAQQVNTKTALAKTRLLPSDIYYVECHGTGTPTGDPLEVQGIAGVFGPSSTKEQPIRIGSVKSNIGHTESTAGVASIIKCAMMLKNRMLIKNINFKELNPKIDLLDGKIKIVLENEPLPNNRVIRMGINSFGLTGSNSHIIVEEYKQKLSNNNNHNNNHSNDLSNLDYLIPFSANSQKSLDSYIDMIKNNVESFKDKMIFEDFVRYQSQSTNHPVCKKLIVAKDWDSFSFPSTTVYEKQQTFVSSMSQLNHTANKPIVMVFCGQGAQWSGMGDKLYDHYKVFRDSVDHVDHLLYQHYQYSIITKLRQSNEKEIHHPILAQPSTFIIQVALVKLYQYFGIIPSIVVGHSFGDITAAWCSGIISLEEAVRIVYLRSVAQNTTIGSGRMLAVSLSFEKYKERFSQQSYESIELACYNSSDSIVLSGDQEQLESINQQLKDDNIFSAFLGTPCSFHSSKQESTKDFIFNHLQNNIKYQCDKPIIPYFSTTTSQQIKSSSEFNAQYIYDNLRNPVLFQQSINNINQFINNNQEYIYLEIAPHSTLSFYLKTLLSQQQQKSPTTILSPLNRKKDQVESIQSCLSQLYFNGVNVDFKNQLTSEKDNQWKDRTRYLPRYQWDAEYLWYEQPTFKKIRLEGTSTTLLGICGDSESLLTFESTIDLARPSYQYLKGHKVKGKYLFPGAGYIENIINAFPNKDIHIHHLEFIAPFFLKEGSPSRLKSSFISSSSTDYQVVFQYYDDKVSKWIKSSVGRLSIKNPQVQDKSFKYDNVEQLKQKSYNIATMTQTDVYEKLAKVGLLYGETFRRVKQISFNQNGFILSEIECCARNHFEESNTVLNASVLDCILHSNLVQFKGEHQKCEVVFDRVEDFHISSNHVPKHPCHTLFNIAKPSLKTKDRQQRGNEFKGSIDIIDQDGNIIIKCKTIICTSLTKVVKTHQAKHPSKFIKQSIYQPKNSPSNNIGSVNQDNVFEYLERFIKSASSTHKIIRVLDFTLNELITFDFLRCCFSCLDSNQSSTIIDFTTQEVSISLDFVKKDNLFFKFYQDYNPSFSLDDQGFLSNSFDLVLLSLDLVQNNKNLTLELCQLLNPNGQLVFIDNYSAPDENRDSLIDTIKSSKLNILQHTINQTQSDQIMLICQKDSIEETKIESFDHLLFITPSLSSSTSSPSSLLLARLIEQSKQQFNNNNNISLFSVDDIMDETKYQILLDSISFNKDHNTQVAIIYLESIEEMKIDNLELKSMQLIRLHQIIRKEQLPIKLITLIASQLNHCLIPICREYQRPSGLFMFDSISITMDDQCTNQISLSQILQYANHQHIGEKHVRLDFINDTIQLSIERFVETPNALPLDERFIITNKQESRVKFEKDSKYHLRPKVEILRDNEVEVQTKAASINFKDLMILEGRVDQRLFPSGDANDPPLGQDCAGVVTRIGSKVSHFKVGDEVYGYSAASFASSSLAKEEALIHKPKYLSFVQAASLPLSMGTAYCVLYKKAHIESDQSILIHGAAGGVGLGMLNLLKHGKHQGKIFVTAGSTEKKDYLKQQYGTFITAILSYDNFTQPILEMTFGKGVNYVVNTLDYTRMHENFKCLYKNGILFDLSVDQFFQVDDIDMGPFKFDKGYSAFHYHLKFTHYHNQIKELIAEGLELPPIKTWPCHQITQALDHVRSRKHIGKVVVDFETVEKEILEPMLLEQKKPIERLHYQLDGVQDTLLITGQTGVAVESLQYIIKHSPRLRDIIVVSYSSPKYEIQLLVNDIKTKYQHVQLHYLQCDIGNYSQLASSIQQLYQTHGSTIRPVKSVIHCANNYVFSLSDDLTLDVHHKALSAKAIGAWNLHNLFEELGWKLNHFHTMSSMAQFTGRESFSYSVANSFLDNLALHRRSLGLSGTSIIWGSIGSTGRVAIIKGSNEGLELVGFNLLPLYTVYGILRASFINHDTPFTVLQCASLSTKFVASSPNLSHLFCLSSDVIPKRSTNINGSQQQDNIENKILEFIAETLSIEKHLLNGDTKLKDYGVDSMIAIQIRSWVESEFKKSNLLNQAQISNGTINSITETINRIYHIK